MPLEVAFWKQWEGTHIDSAYSLERFAGSSDEGAVFETEFQGAPAAIKIVTGTLESIESRIALWKECAGLSHPALVKALATGQTGLGDRPAAYVVMERADDNLAAVLSDRSLTPEESQEMIHPVLDVLQYLHANGFVHGRLKPANIMALGDQLKVSSDNLAPGGDPAVDGRAIGPLLKEVLGTAKLPEPFAGIAGKAAGWGLAPVKTDPAAPPRSRGLLWAAAAGLAAALGLTLFLPSRDSSPLKTPMEEQTPVPLPETKKPPPEPKSKNKPKQEPRSAARETPMGPLTSGAQPAVTRRQLTSEGVTQVLPEIPDPARKTITGKVRIGVRVRVDTAGNVIQATPESPRASKYFTDRVLAAAQAWKFPAGNFQQNWVLNFELTREQSRATSAKLAN